MRFFESGDEPNVKYFYEEDGETVHLTEDTYFAALHEVMDNEFNVYSTEDRIYDKAWVKSQEPPIDTGFWRADVGDEKFQKLEFIARRAGTLLIRQTVSKFIENDFDAEFGIHEGELEELLDGDE